MLNFHPKGQVSVYFGNKGQAILSFPFLKCGAFFLVFLLAPPPFFWSPVLFAFMILVTVSLMIIPFLHTPFFPDGVFHGHGHHILLQYLGVCFYPALKQVTLELPFLALCVYFFLFPGSLIFPSFLLVLLQNVFK